MKYLRRSRKHAIIAGVCAGFAEYIGRDPGLVRLLYITISLVSAAFPGILIYIIAWLLIPEDDNGHTIDI